MKYGNYIRNRFGDIYKIDSLEDYHFLSDKFYNNIVKHSKNIIDLIVIGDIVKYKELSTNEIYKSYIHTEFELKYLKEEIERKGLELLEILTKENFKNNSYKVVE